MFLTAGHIEYFKSKETIVTLKYRVHNLCYLICFKEIKCIINSVIMPTLTLVIGIPKSNDKYLNTLI